MDGGAKWARAASCAPAVARAASLLAAEVLEVVPLLALRVRYPPEDVGVVYAALGAYSPRAAEAPGREAAADAGLLEAVCEVPREAVDVLAAGRDEWPRAARRRRRGRFVNRYQSLAA